MKATNHHTNALQLTKETRIASGETMDVSHLVDTAWWPNIIALSGTGLITLSGEMPKPKKKTTKRKRKPTKKE